MPRNTMVGVSRERGTISTNAFSAAPSKPDFSATPIPSMPTSTMPSGAKPMKLSTMLETAQ